VLFRDDLEFGLVDCSRLSSAAVSLEVSLTEVGLVVVVGAGPTGLLAGCELARRGVPVKVIDTLATPTAESRAIVVHARSLEMLDRVGVADEIIASGVKTLGMRMIASARELVYIDLSAVDSAFPFAVTTAQTETERVLAGRLCALGGSVDRGVTLTGLAQDADGIQLILRHEDDGSAEGLRCAYVVGADGAHSTVRALAGTRLAGSFRGERFMLGDVEAGHELDPSSMYTFFSPDGPLAVFPMAGSRVRLIAQIHQAPGEPLNLNPAQDDLQKIVDARAGGIRILTSHWLTGFEIHHAQVPAYRHGRVFLAGDAAHVHSPAGGQGMNTGMQDAFNLAWKLALAAGGDGGETLLDSYHAERHPVAAAVIKFSNLLTKAATVHGALPVALRDSLVHVVSGSARVQHAMAGKTEEITVGYPDSPIVTPGHPRHARVTGGGHEPLLPEPARARLRPACGPDNPRHAILTITGPAGLPQPPAQHHAVSVLIAASDAAAPGYDLVVADPDRVVARQYGLPDGGRAVIRPDGYVGLITRLDDDTTAYFSRLSS
jgi:2-polyprenyl-6-methoxyphenol hydroxylase-like FAD-dependent oxidoreductase